MMLTDEDLLRVMTNIDPLTKRVPPGLRAMFEAVIAENTKKVLADLKPVQERIAVKMYGYAIFAEIAAKEDLYSAETVSALIQDRDALKARVKELEDECARWLSLLPNPNKMPTRHFDKLPEPFTPDEIGKALGVTP